MVKLLTLGIERLRNAVLSMAKLAEDTVSEAIDASMNARDNSAYISEKLRELQALQEEIVELAAEIISITSPKGEDLRLIRRCVEMSYDFNSYARDAYHISQSFRVLSQLSEHDKSIVQEASQKVNSKLKLGIRSLMEQNMHEGNEVQKVNDMADEIYANLAKMILTPPRSK